MDQAPTNRGVLAGAGLPAIFTARAPGCCGAMIVPSDANAGGTIQGAHAARHTYQKIDMLAVDAVEGGVVLLRGGYKENIVERELRAN